MAINILKIEHKPFAVFFALLAASVLVRFPFFFEAVIDWDESSLILMGQSVLDGDLPYQHLWENKPPLAFVSYALFIALLGKSIISIRIAGAVLVAVTAFLLYRFGVRWRGPATGWTAAGAWMILLYQLPSNQATMTEHIAIVPLLCALLLLSTDQPTPRRLVLAGLLMGIAVLIRSNLAIAALGLGAGLCLVYSNQTWRTRWWLTCAYVSGGLVTLAVVTLPYLFEGELGLLWQSGVQAPLSRVSHGISYSRVVDKLWTYVRPNTAYSWLGFCIWALGALGLVVALIRWPALPRATRVMIAHWFVTTACVALSILLTRTAHEHHLIQLAPFSSLFAALVLGGLLAYAPTLSKLGIALCLAVFVWQVVGHYQETVTRVRESGTLRYSAAYEIADYLQHNNPDKAPVYLLTDHIVYWLTDTRPLTRSTTHPSTISKRAFLKVIVGPHSTPETEMARMLAKKPMFIVKTKSKNYLKSSQNSVLRLTLEDQYQLAEKIEGRLIYRRIDTL